MIGTVVTPCVLGPMNPVRKKQYMDYNIYTTIKQKSVKRRNLRGRQRWDIRLSWMDRRAAGAPLCLL